MIVWLGCENKGQVVKHASVLFCPYNKKSALFNTIAHIWSKVYRHAASQLFTLGMGASCPKKETQLVSEMSQMSIKARPNIRQNVSFYV